ncbi:hypothetical protein JW835_07855 [bacterium]|nr:hypothetical protein [bacterium]
MISRIQEIIIHPDIVESELAKRVLSNRCEIPFKITSTVPETIPLRTGKKILYVTDMPGRLVKPCPATGLPYLCCQYTVIHSCLQCPADCTYCVLQNYLDMPVISLNVRLPDIINEINGLLRNQPRRFFRFGTGELGDSLALDPLTGLSKDFILFFKKQRNAIIELKTKSVHIERLLEIDPANTVVSWSVNPEPVIRTEELHTPSLKMRLDAARQCQEAGYLLGFHFDPILHINHWELLYREVVDQIFSSVDANRVAWISLGSLRFPPALKQVIQSRFPGTRIIYEEMIRGLDGKMRYLKPLRTALYQHIYQRIRSFAPDVFIYFCMELPQIWERITGKHPMNNAELDYWFAESLWRRFGPELNMDEPRLPDYPLVK